MTTYNYIHYMTAKTDNYVVIACAGEVKDTIPYSIKVREVTCPRCTNKMFEWGIKREPGKPRYQQWEKVK